MTLISTDVEKFLREFVFRLIPLGSSVTDMIVNAVNSSESSGPSTLARIFKGYTYDGAKHSIKLGLAELAGNSNLADLDLSLTGANDGDDDTVGILNNYVASAHVETSFVKLVTLSLDEIGRAHV